MRRTAERPGPTARLLVALVLVSVTAACGTMAAPPIGTSGSTAASATPTPAPSADRSSHASSMAGATAQPGAPSPVDASPTPPQPSRAGSGTAGPGATGTVPSTALQATLGRFLLSSGTPGVSASIEWPDGRTWTGTAGFADLARRTPVTANTAFAVASMSKTFTAALVLRLVEEGMLGLDDSVARLLSDRRIDPRITVRMLLDHTSGLYDVFLAPGIDRALQAAPTRRWTVDDALAYARKPYFPPGRGWHYSNTNYLLLGLVAERVTGRTLATELHRRFLEPLGLHRTWVQAAEAPLAPIAHGYVVTGRRPGFARRDVSDGTGVAPFTSVVTAIDGAGSLAATSGDLARWAADLYGGRVLSPATLAAMVDDQQRTTAYIPGVLYGLGVQVYQVGPWTTLGHSGRLLGFRGQMRYVPATGIAIAVVTNQSRTDVGPLVSRLLAIVLPPIGTPRAARR